MFETFGFETVTARQASVVLGLLAGLLFGALAQRTKFCFRRGLVGDATERRAALGVWLAALAAAIFGTQAAVAAGLISFDEHRFYASELPYLAIIAGGVMFGAGMILTRGCVSRLTVLAGSGNLRAVLVLGAFAIVAHATLKGVLAPVRTALGSVTFPLGDTVSLSSLPGGALVWGGLLVGTAAYFVLHSGNRATTLLLAVALGLLVPVVWVATGFILFDEFDPIALESLSFTSPASETLFWSIASSSIPAGFGTGLIGGVLVGSLLAAVTFREFEWQSFDTPRQTGRYLAGASLMGIGGVLAGGCTVGAGLSGIPTLSIAALLATLSIAAGGVATNAALTRATPFVRGSGAPDATLQAQPAE